MIGAFHQPSAVITDVNTLQTLPEREYLSGFAEVIKYGLIQDAAFFTWLNESVELLLQKDPDALIYAITRSCQIKADIVAADTKEQGQRALLNLGHTFAHAIESATDYQSYRHGEAVAIGLVLAAKVSQHLGYIDASVVEQIKTLCERFKLPTQLPAGMTCKDLMPWMARDKKIQKQQFRLILLKSLGEAVIDTTMTRNALSHFEEGAIDT